MDSLKREKDGTRVMNVPSRWIIPPPQDPVAIGAVTSRLVCTEGFAALLLRKGLDSPDDATRYLRPQLKTLSDPFLLPDMRQGVEVLLRAIDAGKRITLYGDYDVDGVTSLALLTRVLRAYGATPACFLPMRIEEGYGLTMEGVQRAVDSHCPELLIALDCGTSSSAEIAWLRERGIEVMVLDHHECTGDLPACQALINPKREDAPAIPDYRYLCSVGVVFKLAHALLKQRPIEGFVLKEYLDLVALGTVADLVPLVEENRVLVQRGLLQMAETRWVGLQALMEVARVKVPLTPVELGFQLGPRLNAAGRLGTAEAALELLLSDDAGRARALAVELDVQNRERQSVEKRTHEEAEAQVLAGGNPLDRAAIVVGSKGWHPGVIGIVASRIAKKFHRPTFVIGFDEEGAGKGSGRSIEGLSIVAALEPCAHLLERYGGHEMAAGLSISEERFCEFQQAFTDAAASLLQPEDLLPPVKIDGELELCEVSMAFLERHEQMQPFGMGNAQPLFLARGVTPMGVPVVMKERHLKMQLQHRGSRQEAVFFNALPEDLPRPPWDIAFRLSKNEWRDRVTVQMQIYRIRSAE